MLSKIDLINQINEGKKFKYEFFWGGPFSQWCLARFKIDDLSYNCAEQYMMSEKARFFKDEDSFKKIMQANTPDIQKSLGRKIKNFDEQAWDIVKKDVVIRGNYAKFVQNKKLEEILLFTKDSILVEASPFDKIWGIGLKENDPKAMNPMTWKGENLLGFCLIEVRERLKNKI